MGKVFTKLAELTCETGQWMAVAFPSLVGNWKHNSFYLVCLFRPTSGAVCKLACCIC